MTNESNGSVKAEETEGAKEGLGVGETSDVCGVEFIVSLHPREVRACDQMAGHSAPHINVRATLPTETREKFDATALKYFHDREAGTLGPTVRREDLLRKPTDAPPSAPVRPPQTIPDQVLTPLSAHPSVEWLNDRRDRAWTDLIALLDGLESMDDKAARSARLEQGGFMLAYYRDCEREAIRAPLEAENARLLALINAPEVNDFIEGQRREAAHQTERWGEEHDAAKGADDWFWLVGYVAGKALRAAIEGDYEKAKHHLVTVATVSAQWHKRRVYPRRPGMASELRPNDAQTLEAIRRRVNNRFWPTRDAMAEHYREDVRFLIERIDELTVGVVAEPTEEAGNGA